MQYSCTACASSRIAILVSKPQMYTGSNATSLLLQLCLLRERNGLRPRVPTTLLRETALLRETVRLRPWTRDLWLLRERTRLRPRVPTTLLRETVLFCPELRVLRLIPTGVETRIPTGIEIRTNLKSGRQRFLHAAHARRLYQPSCGQQ